jgi:hypothetical protein
MLLLAEQLLVLGSKPCDLVTLPHGLRLRPQVTQKTQNYHRYG